MGYRASSRTAVSATAVVGVLLVSCLTAIGLPTAPAADAAVLPEGAETFEVSGDHGGESQDAFLTPDAQQIVFTSSAIDLVPGDDNGVPDVFLEKSIEGSDDPFSREPVLVSVPDGPVGVARANDWSSEAVSSADGRYVAFTSAATNLVDLPSTGDGRSYVYVRDTANSTTIRIQGADEPNGSSFLPDLSDDGRYLVFTSEADNLVSSPDLNGAADSFVVDLDANADGARGDLMIEQVASGGAQTGTHDVVISGDGNVVAYLSTSDPRTPLDPPRGTDGLYFMRLERTDERILSDAAVLIDDNIVGRVSIDSTGYVYSYVRAARMHGSGRVRRRRVVVDGGDVPSGARDDPGRRPLRLGRRPAHLGRRQHRGVDDDGPRLRLRERRGACRPARGGRRPTAGRVVVGCLGQRVPAVQRHPRRRMVRRRRGLPCHALRVGADGRVPVARAGAGVRRRPPLRGRHLGLERPRRARRARVHDGSPDRGHPRRLPARLRRSARRLAGPPHPGAPHPGPPDSRPPDPRAPHPRPPDPRPPHPRPPHRLPGRLDPGARGLTVRGSS